MTTGKIAWDLPDEGALFVVSGPSGVGKSTLVKAAMARIDGLAFSVSATTRAPRPGEVDGVDYRFLAEDTFAELVDADAFIEHATVYDRRYGTLDEPTRAELAAGRSLILDIDVQGARQVRHRMPEAVHVMILPPSIAVLEQRLVARGTDDATVIARRMTQVAEQIGACGEFDYLVVNDDLDSAHAAFQSIVVAELSRRSRRDAWVVRVAEELAARGG